MVSIAHKADIDKVEIDETDNGNLSIYSQTDDSENYLSFDRLAWRVFVTYFSKCANYNVPVTATAFYREEQHNTHRLLKTLTADNGQWKVIHDVGFIRYLNEGEGQVHIKRPSGQQSFSVEAIVNFYLDAVAGRMTWQKLMG